MLLVYKAINIIGNDLFNLSLATWYTIILKDNLKSRMVEKQQLVQVNSHDNFHKLESIFAILITSLWGHSGAYIHTDTAVGVTAGITDRHRDTERQRDREIER